MKKKIINGLLFAVAMVAATSSFVSCKDYNGDNYAELQEKYLTMQAAFDKQVDAMKAYVLQSQYDSEVGTDYPTAKGTIKKRLEDLETDLANQKDDNVENSLAWKIHQNNIAIATARGIADEALNRSKNDSIYLRSLLAGWDTGGELGDMVAEAAGLLTHMKNNKDAYDKAVENAQAAYDFIKDSKFNNIKELETAYDGAVAKLNTRIDSLRDVVNELKEVMRAEVTGIEIQATYNPIFGTFSYPIGVQSNILGAYYGICDVQLVKFPASDATPSQIASWATKAPAITKDELEAIFDGEYFVREKNDTMMIEGAGNAGKLYLTVNPSNVIMDGKEFTLRASDNSVSKVALSPLETCTEQLKWGYNRAASANGFYVATAEIKKESVNDVALSFNLKGMAKQIQSMMSDWSKTSASDIAKLALTIHDGLKTDVPRLGVQAQWKDELGWKNYVSKYDVAAVSVKPLGFDFLLTEDESGNVVPMDFSQGIVKFKNKLTAKEKAVSAELINKIAKLVAFELNLGAITQENIEITPDGKIYVIVSSATKPLTLTIAKGSLYNTTTVVVPAADKELTITDDNKINITPLFDEINKAIQTKLAEVQNEANGAVNKVLNKILDIENKIFGKVEAIAKNPNRYIQPALVGKCDQLGFFYPSRDFLAPTQIKRGQKIMFYPTTLTGEVVAPAFKKYVAVCGAWDVNNIYDTKPAKQFNTGLNTVFNGADYNMSKPIEYTVDAPAGTVLEFIYECLGYNGKVAGKKYYIEVYE